MSAPFGGHSRIVQAGLCTVLILLVGAAACAQTGAGQSNDAVPINMDLRGASLRQLLPLLTEAADISIILGGPDVDVQLDGLSLRDITRDEIIEVLKALAEAQGYHWAEVGRFYMVTTSPPPPAQVGPAPQTATARIDGGTAPLRAPEPIAPLPATAAPPASSELLSAEIALDHVNAEDVARMFGGTALYPRPSPEQASRTSRGAPQSFGTPLGGNWGAPGQQRGMGPMAGSPVNQFGGDYDQDFGGGGFGGGGFGGGGFGGGGFGGGFGMIELLPGEMMPPMAYMPLNKLIVRGTQSELDAFREVVALLDVAPRQVEIATQFIEVSANIFEAFGSTWSAIGGNYELFPTGTGLAGNLVGRFRSENFEATLSVAMSRAKGRIVNAPRVVTLNNQFAEFSVTTDIPFFSPQTQVTQGVVTTTYNPAAISVANGLFVTPRINADDTISMYLQPTLSDQVGEVISPDGAQVLPILSTQYASAIVRVPDGETAVMGGLVRRTDTERTVGTPFLSELPIIGKLFQNRSVNKDDRELLIFVTPRIIRERGGGLDTL